MIGHRFDFEAYGVPLGVQLRGRLTARLVRSVKEVLPPIRSERAAGVVPLAVLTLDVGPGGLSVTGVGGRSTDFWRECDAVDALDAEISATVACAAPGLVFVRAGAVRGAGGVIVVPGGTATGKTRLVTALVRAGAEYMSDGFAVLDESGAVRSYPRRLSFRTPDGERTDVSGATLGRVASPAPVPVALVVSTAYRPGAQWCGVPGAAAAGAAALVDNAVAAQVRPDEVLAAAAAAVRSARYISGERGDAHRIADDLLAMVGGPPLLAGDGGTGGRQHPPVPSRTHQSAREFQQ